MSSESVLPSYSMNRADFPRMYENEIVGPLFRPWAEALLDRAELAAGMRVLDVACGTGIVARLARQRLGDGARVVGVDVSPPMLEVAREVESAIDWRVGDAAALPVAADERFERVLCQQGVQFFGDRAKGVAEFRRVLAPGGRVLASVWSGPDALPVFGGLQRIAERHVGAIHDERYAFGDAAALRALFQGAGFSRVDVTAESISSRFKNGRELVHMNTIALLGMSGAKLDDAERERLLATITDESLAAMKQYFEGDTLVCEMRSNVVVAS